MFIVCNLLILIVELITHNKQMNLNKTQKGIQTTRRQRMGN